MNYYTYVPDTYAGDVCLYINNQMSNKFYLCAYMCTYAYAYIYGLDAPYVDVAQICV